MDLQKIISAIFILLIIPLVGLLFFLLLKKRMISERILNPPIKALFAIFVTYGGLLLVALTAFFLQWSGAASLGTFYLILGAPIVMSLIAFKNYKNRQISTYHQWTFKLALLYFVIAAIAFLSLYWSDAYLRC